MILDTLITDRTELDVIRYQNLQDKGIANMSPDELSEYLNGMKGAYNATDFQRVQEAIDYVNNRLLEFGYSARLDELVPAFLGQDLRTDYVNTYLSNLRKLRSVIAVYKSTPPVPDDMDEFAVQEANDIERIILDIDELLTKSIYTWWHCNAAICGMRGVIR